MIENGARRHHPIQALEVCDVGIVAKGKNAAIRDLLGEQGLRPGQLLFFMSPARGPSQRPPTRRPIRHPTLWGAGERTQGIFGFPLQTSRTYSAQRQLVAKLDDTTSAPCLVLSPSGPLVPSTAQDMAPFPSLGPTSEHRLRREVSVNFSSWKYCLRRSMKKGGNR